MGTGQNCTRLLNCTKIFCTKGQNCTKTIFSQGSILQELQFCKEGHFCTRVKKQKKKLKDKSIKKNKKKKEVID